MQRESFITIDNSSRTLKVVDADQLQKQVIWLYFILLIFEGALRKWFLPSLATPLLVIRDPIAMWLIMKAWQKGLFPSTLFLTGMVSIGIVSTFSAVLIGHGNLWVALYGARILLLHFPLIFVIGRIFNREDVEKIGKVALWITIPMTILIALQFYSPQSAWVNRGVGGDMAGAGFTGALGYSRPPGTFSFTNGTTLYYSFVAPFIFYFWLYPKEISRIILLIATAALLAAIPLSISRALLFSVGVTFMFISIAIIRKPKYMGKLIFAGIGGILALAVLSQIGFFQTAMEAFSSRFENATESEGGLEGVLIDRYLGGMVGALFDSYDLPFFGYGIGMGTNVGSMLLTGSRMFLIAEGEWGRMIGELGPLMGLSAIFIRLGLAAKIALASYKKLTKGDLLPWVLLSFFLITFPQGLWAQPTSLGFSILIGGLMLASLRVPKKAEALFQQ